MKLFTDEIYSFVKVRILSGDYKPGTRINIGELSENFKSSRLPVRDALHRLSGEGLVQTRNNGGYFVTPLTEMDIRETYELRGILEGYLAGQAALKFNDLQIKFLEENIKQQEKGRGDVENYRRLNNIFHEFFFQASSNTKFLKTIKELRDYQDRFDRINWHSNGAPFINVTFGQHQEIVDAVKRRDPDLAERMIKLHMNTGVEFLIPALKRKNLLQD